MIDEERFIRVFWNTILADLTKENLKLPKITTTADEVISRFDDITINNNVTSFGYDVGYGTLKFSIGMNFNIHSNYNIEIRMDPVKKKYCGAYLEVNLVHENEDELLANTYLPFLPFNAVNDLLKKISNIDELFFKELTEFRKKKKLRDLHFSLIKSLLMIKFQNSSLKWNIIDLGNDSEFKIVVYNNDEEIWSDFVTDKDCNEKIDNMELDL